METNKRLATMNKFCYKICKKNNSFVTQRQEEIY